MGKTSKANSSSRAKKDTASREIEQMLRSEFDADEVECYRFNNASLRLRIISERFEGKSRTARERMVKPLIKQLGEDVQRDLILILLLTPQEHESSIERLDLLDIEFDDPGGSDW